MKQWVVGISCISSPPQYESFGKWNSQSLNQVVRAVFKVSHGLGYFSATLFQQAILKFYDSKSLLPKGMKIEMECAQKWSLKMGLALRRMAP